MEIDEFKKIRSGLNKTQERMAQLLGVSVKAVRSYEQGWRKIPGHIEKQLLFLISKAAVRGREVKFCWDINDCPQERRAQCPAWEFNAGDCCWMVNGTICSGRAYAKWDDKIKICKKCKVLKPLLQLYK